MWIFTLILITGSSSAAGATSLSQEFGTEKACKDQVEAITRQYSIGNARFIMTCVPKGVSK